MDIKKIIEKMTLEDKISFCTGSDMWHTKEMKEYGIPSIMVSDGPHGLRCQRDAGDNLGINESLPATCFPTAVTAANSWNEGLLQEEGKAIAKQALEYGVSVVLGPGVNIKRNPLAGRNFEYYSEDPYQAGKLATAFIHGVQGMGIGVSLKHFACNNQEYKRQNGNSIVDQRAFHEIYLKPFEIAVKQAKPSTVMCSYNQINGVYSSDNKELLTDILRKDWGFDGLVMTDWGALVDRIKAFKAGCDLNMPGGSKYMEKAAFKAVKSGQLSEEDINKSVERILVEVEKGVNHRKDYTFDREEQHNLAKQIALEGAVLLKNEGALPLRKESIGFFGYFAEDIRYQGSGSSHINPTKLNQLNQLFPIIPYASGVDKNGNAVDIESAVSLAKSVEVPVIFAGLPDIYESEGFDRDNMRIPDGYNQLIEAISAVNKNTVVVLFGGSVMELPWESKVNAILYMGLPGQAGSEAVMELLEGKVNPSGKLSESWPISYADVISNDTFGQKYTEYRESIYVGYRYYDKANVKVRYPFGHGLSYTTFEYSNPVLVGNVVSIDVTNTGETAGKEIVQLYVGSNHTFRAAKELKAFEKVELLPGQTKTVSFEIRDDFFEIYQEGFKKVAGSYELLFAASSADIKASIRIDVDGEAVEVENEEDSWYQLLKGKPTKAEFEKILGYQIKPYHEAKQGEYSMDNSCFEMKDGSLVMKIEYLITKMIVSKPFTKKERTMDNPAYKMMVTVSTDCPLRAAVISSSGAMSDSLAAGLVEMANGHYLRGIKKMLEK